MGIIIITKWSLTEKENCHNARLHITHKYTNDKYCATFKHFLGHRKGGRAIKDPARLHYFLTTFSSESFIVRKKAPIEKFVAVVGLRYFKVARSYTLVAFSSLSYPPKHPQRCIIRTLNKY